MASIIFSHSKSCINAAKKKARKFSEHIDDRAEREAMFKRMYDKYLEEALQEFDEYLEFSSKLHQRYEAKCIGKSNEHHYMITIRPKLECDATIVDLVSMTDRLLKRSCFLEYSYSYEQKGTCPEDLGKGFHVHIIARMKQRSKGEVVRDCVSTFNSWIEKGWMEPQGIDVKITKNPDDVVQNYLIEYKSDDDHKAPTKEWDSIWRNANGLQDIYRSPQAKAENKGLQPESVE